MAKTTKQPKEKKSILESRGFKKFMAKLYGIGASIVIVGALFKIQHYEGANIMLPIGLGTEAIIFFFSALQKPHVEPDWSRVYPEFIDLYHTPDEAQKLHQLGKIPDPNSKTQFGGGGNGGSNVALDALLEKADISNETIDKFGQGIKKFSDQTEKLGDITQATVATDKYVKNMEKASGSVQKMSESFDQASETLKSGFANTEEFSGNVKKASEAAGKLADVYANNSQAIEKEGKSYLDVANKLKDNLSALNSVYELQLQESNKQKEATEKLSKNVDSFVSHINASNEATEEYQKQVSMLNERVSALNNVYGNMLTAMNVNTNK